MLPSCIEDLAGPPEPSPPAQQAATLRLMDHILHVTLLQVMLLPCGRASRMTSSCEGAVSCGLLGVYNNRDIFLAHP